MTRGAKTSYTTSFASVTKYELNDRPNIHSEEDFHIDCWNDSHNQQPQPNYQQACLFVCYSFMR